MKSMLAINSLLEVDTLIIMEQWSLMLTVVGYPTRSLVDVD
jgi:hypothetical protein